MKITSGQFHVKSKDIKHNYEAIRALSQKAIEESYDMIVFGEYALCGYACAELFKQESFYNEIDAYVEKLKDLSKDIIIVFGSVLKEDDDVFVVSVILNKNEKLISYKENLNKREFDESLYFKAKDNKTFTIHNETIRFTFKEDVKPCRNLQIVLDSSPVNNSLEVLENTVYANTIGISQVAKAVFINGGNSYVNDHELKTYNHPLEKGLLNSSTYTAPVSKLDALTEGLKQFSLNNFGNNKKWIVGNSGGLDSAVTLSLLSIALGSENVISYNLRSKYNSEKTVNNAAFLAKNLNVKHFSHSIDDAVDGYLKTLEGFNYSDIPTLAYENIQARTRGHLLGGFSSLEDAIISNNGNKLEIMLGYATLYGDTIGAVSSIGDLLKIEVFDLALEINEYFKKEVIPNNLLPKENDYKISFDVAPSAELKSDQLDPMKWYYHDLLATLILEKSKLEILELYYKNQFEGLEISKWLSFYDLDKGKNFIDDFNWFTRTFEINNFKRLQMPPVLVYSSQVIGVDYKENANLQVKSLEQEKLEALIIKRY